MSGNCITRCFEDWKYKFNVFFRFGFVEFDSLEDAQSCYQAMQGYELDGRSLTVDYATEGGRGGGGGGGGGRGGFRGEGNVLPMSCVMLFGFPPEKFFNQNKKG